MGYIETSEDMSYVPNEVEFNNNMGYIETMESYTFCKLDTPFNNNMGYIETAFPDASWPFFRRLITIWDILKPARRKCLIFVRVCLITIWDILKQGYLTCWKLSPVSLITIWDILKQGYLTCWKLSPVRFNNNMGYIETKLKNRWKSSCGV